MSTLSILLQFLGLIVTLILSVLALFIFILLLLVIFDVFRRYLVGKRNQKQGHKAYPWVAVQALSSTRKFNKVGHLRVPQKFPEWSTELNALFQRNLIDSYEFDALTLLLQYTWEVDYLKLQKGLSPEALGWLAKTGLLPLFSKGE